MISLWLIVPYTQDPGRSVVQARIRRNPLRLFAVYVIHWAPLRPDLPGRLPKRVSHLPPRRLSVESRATKETQCRRPSQLAAPRTRTRLLSP